METSSLGASLSLLGQCKHSLCHRQHAGFVGLFDLLMSSSLAECESATKTPSQIGNRRSPPVARLGACAKGSTRGVSNLNQFRDPEMVYGAESSQQVLEGTLDQILYIN